MAPRGRPRIAVACHGGLGLWVAPAAAALGWVELHLALAQSATTREEKGFLSACLQGWRGVQTTSGFRTGIH